MEQYTGAAPAGDGADAGTGAPRTGRRRGIRRLLTLPVAVASTVAVTLGIVQPAAAAAPTVKRQAKAKAQSGAPAPVRTTAAPASTVPAEVEVLEGDTVSAIAARYGLSTAEVLAENGLSWSSLIFPGQRLALPGGAAAASTAPPVSRPEIERHVVAAGDTVSGIAAAHGLEVDVVLSANGLSRASLIFPGQAIVLPATDGTGPDAPPAAPPAAEPAPSPQETLEATAVVMLDVAMDEEMRANARIVVDVGRALGIPDRGIVIALAAAAQESGLRNLDHGDQDSLGLFQQRPSQGWGTAEQVRDPVRAAAAFYGGPDSPTVGTAPGLLDVDGWDSMPLTDAAQAVQHSAHPGHYAKWEASAERWLAELG